MAEKLKIISLGGLNEIGKNMTVYEYGGDIIVIDVGMGFPDDDMYGIDVVIPDFSYLIKNKDRIRGIFLTHGHEDHIGSIPYLLRDINVPIYATRMTAGLVKLKLEEHRLLNKTKLITCEAGEVVKAGKFSVEFIHANHSIADAVCFAIKCGVGTVVHTGDFKIDPTPIQGGMMDLGRLGQLGKEGVLALLADSTNVERPGFTKSERSVGDSFDALFRLFRFASLGEILRLARYLDLFSYAMRFTTRIRRFFNTNGFKYICIAALVIILLGAVGIHLAEGMSLPNGIWWSFVTATTVGYGDTYPVTTSGKFLAVFLMLTGIGFVGTLTSTITSFFLSPHGGEALPYREEEIEAIKKKLDDLSSMTDEDIDTMAALLKTLRDAPHPHAEAKEETSPSGSSTI